MTVELGNFIGWSVAIWFLGFVIGMGTMYAFLRRYLED